MRRRKKKRAATLLPPCRLPPVHHRPVATRPWFVGLPPRAQTGLDGLPG